jgi:hypothetical protein
VQYVVGGIALLVGLAAGVAATWAALQGRIATVSRERDEQVEQVREVERQLHGKDIECLDRLSTQKRELMAAHQTELTEAISETREAQRAELEHQSKLFSVKVSPYVEISESRVLMRSRYRGVSGYQYQLLINGIPAFAPHVVQERVETADIVDEDKLIQVALTAAQAVVAVYSGSASQFFEIARPIVRRLGPEDQRGDA